MRIAALPSRLRGPLSFWALAGVALLLSHDAVYLVQVGPGERLASALRTASHDYWAAASLALIGVAIAAGVATLVRIAVLRRRAVEVSATVGRQPRPLGRLVGIWLRLAALIVIGFAIQENVEHYISHGHLIGGGALVGPEYPLALPVLGFVSFVAALAAALLVTTELALVAAILSAAGAMRRAQGILTRPPQRLPAPAGSVLARFVAGRAPPMHLVSN